MMFWHVRRGSDTRCQMQPCPDWLLAYKDDVEIIPSIPKKCLVEPIV
jgi:hypothetical protein